MTHELPGNPHYSKDWGRGIDVGYHGDQAQSEVLAAQVDATLALAYEQRTANLLKVLELQGRMHDAQQAFNLSAFDVAPRLGLGDTR